MQVHHWNEQEVEQLNALLGRQVLHTEHMTISRLTLTKGAVVPEHHHINEQVTTVVQGKLLFLMEGKEQIVNAGESLVIPPNVPHRVETLEDSIAVDTFVPRREDWIRGDDAYLRR